MNIKIDEALRSYIDPLTASEYAALERSLLAEGCRDALVLWGEVLIDGHNRYAICRQHGIPFNTVQNTGFASLDDVMLWMIDNHLARRSVSDFQRGVLALRKKEIVAARAAARPPAAAEQGEAAAAPAPLSTREEIAKAARVSSNLIGQIEKIRKTAAPELVEAVRRGAISINAAATVASLPEAEQVAAVAGGRKQLQLAAREIRAQRAAARPPRAPTEHGEQGEPKEPMEQGEDAGPGLAGPDLAGPDRAGSVPALSELALLRAEVARLKAENAMLSARLAALV